MPDEGAALLQAAERAEAACDLEAGLPATQAAALLQALDGLDPARATPRAVWNLLWLAAELADRADVYRALALFDAAARLVERLAPALTGISEDGGPLADAVEMAFDFFFHRESSPVASFAFDRARTTLSRLAAHENRTVARAAIHGLGHLRDHAPTASARSAVDGLLDAVTDPALRPLARLALSGTLP